jgi:hypothetical protein
MNIHANKVDYNADIGIRHIFKQVHHIVIPIR